MFDVMFEWNTKQTPHQNHNIKRMVT